MPELVVLACDVASLSPASWLDQGILWVACRQMRHPGYFGWIVWAVGTQVLLLNPICSILFAIVVRIFCYLDFCHQKPD